MDEQAFEVLARYYDLDYGTLQDDIDLYQEFARLLEASILELGVGTGRIAIPLAQAGFSVVGIDSSPAMLTVARSKLDKAPAQRVNLMEADMRDFHLSQQFGLIICPLSAFRHLLTPDDQRQALACITAHLARNGLFVLDVPSPEPGWWETGAHSLVLDWIRTHPETGRAVYKYVSEHTDKSQQLHYVTHIYDEVDETGVVHRRSASFTLRNVMRYEMEMLLAQAGLRVESIYGSYDLESYRPESHRMIFVASKMAGER